MNSLMKFHEMSLRTGIIIAAILEAIVLIPIIVYKIFFS